MTRNARTGLFFGAALAIVMATTAPAPVLAQDFSPAVVVNDQIITGYDIDQRRRLLAAAGGGDVSREDAADELINDLLRLQAASRAGIDPTKADIDAGFADLSRSQGRDPAAMRQYFRSQGISDRHLDNQVKAEVAWRELIPRTYMPRIRVSDAEIDEMRDTTSAAAPTEPEFLISEIRLPVGAGGQQAALAEAAAIVRQLQTGSTSFGDLARQRSSSETAPTGGDAGWVGLSTMSPAMRQVVSVMTKDRVSAPFVDGNEVAIIGVRDTRVPAGAAATRYRISQLVVGAAPDVAPSIAQQAMQQARIAKTRVTDCASVEALKGEYLSISGEVGTLSPDEMPAAVRNAVLTMPVGGITDPIRSNDGFHIIVLCDKVGGEAAAPTAGADEGQIRQRLTGTKLNRYAVSLLRKLRREAVIERR